MKNSSAIKQQTWLPYLVIMLHQILAACAFPIAKLGLHEIDPFVFAFFRFSFASLVYAPILIFLSKRQKISKKDNRRILLGGMVIIPFNQVLYLIGQSKTLANHSGLLFATVPVFLYILAIFILKEKATLRKTAGILVATIGVYTILSGGKVEFGTEYLYGDILILICVLAWACGTIILKPLTNKYGAFRVIGLALTYGSIAYFPFGFWQASQAPLSSISLTGWLSVCYMAVGLSVLGYFFWYWTLKYMDVTQMAILHNFKPIIATV
ncbi:MAG: DMT family transporter, partial [candidate division Zixibacteria bacterium]|nr:DMT family transporter [candidate division Zixibacteria bacterium]